MDQIKIGKFIAKLRKEKNMTQQNLADKLGVSFKTVSKWETGKGMPDISLLQNLCEELEITINELLYGEIINSKEMDLKEIEKISEENLINTTKFISNINVKKMYINILSVMYFLTIIICLICDLAINKDITWFPIVLFSVGIGYCATVLPALLNKYKSFISLSLITILTYGLIYICCKFLNGNWFLSIGLPITTICFSFVWIVYLILILKIQRLLKISLCNLIFGLALIIINSSINSILYNESFKNEVSKYFKNNGNLDLLGNKIAFYCFIAIAIYTFFVHISKKKR